MKISDLLKEHVVIGGQTQSGKTTFANELALRTERCIFVNPQGEPKPPGFYETETLDARIVIKNTHINFVPHRIDDLKKAVRYALAMGKNGYKMHVFIDEAHLYDKVEEIELIPRIGLKWGVKQVTISQRLNDVASRHRAVLTQARYLVLFSLSRFERGVLRYYGLQDIEMELPPHYFAVYDTAKDRIQKFKPLRIRS